MQVIQVRDNDWQTQLGNLAGIIGGMMFNNRLDRGALREANNQAQKEELARQQGFTSGLTNLQGLYQNPEYVTNKNLQNQAMNIQADLAGRGYRNAFGLNADTIGGALTNNTGAIDYIKGYGQANQGLRVHDQNYQDFPQYWQAYGGLTQNIK
jgi:hypothetical protein|nr:MAG TPA: hypothetical protein [Caudoviricetes sp.]